ncbi:MAG: flagellar biosynthesis protein FlhA [Alphaproteobacteria bacterium]|nr:flagellar biosynthesis protein FlhA [Alphaproteobacteria bacterium]
MNSATSVLTPRLSFGTLRQNLTSMVGPAAFVLILAMVIVPLPPLALDFFFTFNICFGLMILLAALYTAKSTDFAAFPTLLLMTTLLRLALNVAAARVILLDGYMGSDAAGRVIESFGAFVIGGNYAVGIAVFAILIIINFVVITKGAGRIAEVAARFVLDGMPGKQMAIDADLNAGLINQEEATRRRQDVSREADFFGAMDGASKFVRGDAVAAVLILFINLIGGLIIGVWQHELSLAEAAQTYTLLTVGDGLVAQIPALVISSAAGVIVSRVTTGHDVGGQIISQFANYPKAWMLASGIVGLFGLIPGMPHVPFVAFAGVLGGTGWWIDREQRRAAQAPPAPPLPQPDSGEIDIGVVELVEPLEVQLGYRLVGLVSNERDGGLLRRLRAVRRQVSREFGYLVPVVHVRDNPDLKSTGYRILIHGVERASGEVFPDRLMAMSTGRVLREVHGSPTRDPVFGRPALWVMPAAAEEARGSGYTVFDAPVIIATHFERVIRENIDGLFGRGELEAVLKHLGTLMPKIVEELTPKVMSLTVVHNVLTGLLAEHVPIRDLRTIISTLIEAGGTAQEPRALLQFVRQRLGGFIVQTLFGAIDELKVLALESGLERLLHDVVRLAANSISYDVEPTLAAEVQMQAAASAARFEAAGSNAVVLVRPELRECVLHLLRPVHPRISVLGFSEVPPAKRIKVVELLGRAPEGPARAG